jgi:outer membrane protein
VNNQCRKIQQLLVTLALLGATSIEASENAQPQIFQLSRSLSLQKIEEPNRITPKKQAFNLQKESKKWELGNTSCSSKPNFTILTLEITLQLALCQHPKLRQAQAQSEERTTEVNLAELSKRPDLQSVLQYSAQKNRQTNFLESTRKGVEVGLSANWVLYDFGQQSANIRAAQLQLQSALESEKSTWLGVVRDVFEQYLNASTAWVNLIAAQEILLVARRTEEFTNARYLAKVGNQIDQLQAQTAAFQAELDLVRAQNEWNEARTSLAVLIGLPVTENLNLNDTDSEIEIDEPFFMKNETARSKILSQHPRIQAIHSRILALNELREAVRASYTGQISLDLFAGRVNDEIAGFQESRTNSTGNIRASIPLFTKNLQQERDRQLLMQQNAAQAELDETLIELQKELWQAYQSLLLSQASQNHTAQLLTTAKRTHELALGRFKAGVGSIIELLNAQTALANAQQQESNSKADVIRKQIRYLLARGTI